MCSYYWYDNSTLEGEEVMQMNLAHLLEQIRQTMKRCRIS